jgi:competence protein ComGC
LTAECEVLGFTLVLVIVVLVVVAVVVVVAGGGTSEEAPISDLVCVEQG